MSEMVVNSTENLSENPKSGAIIAKLKKNKIVLIAIATCIIIVGIFIEYDKSRLHKDDLVHGLWYIDVDGINTIYSFLESDEIYGVTYINDNFVGAEKGKYVIDGNKVLVTWEKRAYSKDGHIVVATNKNTQASDVLTYSGAFLFLNDITEPFWHSMGVSDDGGETWKYDVGSGGRISKDLVERIFNYAVS